MIPGRLAVVVLLVLAVLAQAGHALAAGVPSGWSLEQLMMGLSEIKSATTRYTEDQYIGIVTTPLRSAGTLIYRAPGRLEKNRLEPSQQSIVIDGDTLTMQIAKARPRSLKLSDRPEIGAFIASIRSTLNGDLAGLQRFYRVALDGDADRWLLTLDPSDVKIQRAIKTVRIAGSQWDLQSVEIVHADGDRSVMTMVKTAP